MSPKKDRSIDEKFRAMSERPVAANAGKDCTEALDALDIPSTVFPSSDNIDNFFRKSVKALPDMTRKDMACVKKEMSLLVTNAKSPDAKTIARRERDDLVKKMDAYIKKLDQGKSRGTTLTISAPRKFEEFK